MYNEETGRRAELQDGKLPAKTKHPGFCLRNLTGFLSMLGQVDQPVFGGMLMLEEKEFILTTKVRGSY